LGGSKGIKNIAMRRRCCGHWCPLEVGFLHAESLRNVGFRPWSRLYVGRRCNCAKKQAGEWIIEVASQDHMFSRFICWARCRIVQIKIVKTGSHKSSFEQNSNNSGNARRGRAWKGAVSTGRGAVVIVDTP